MEIKDGDYIPSTAPGLTWKVWAGKRNGYVYACAMEGRRSPGSFETELGAGRVVRVGTMATRATAKANAAALAQLRRQLIAGGLIEA